MVDCVLKKAKRKHAKIRVPFGIEQTTVIEGCDSVEPCKPVQCAEDGVRTTNGGPPLTNGNCAWEGIEVCTDSTAENLQVPHSPFNNSGLTTGVARDATWGKGQGIPKIVQYSSLM